VAECITVYVFTVGEGQATIEIVGTGTQGDIDRFPAMRTGTSKQAMTKSWQLSHCQYCRSLLFNHGGHVG